MTTTDQQVCVTCGQSIAQAPTGEYYHLDVDWVGDGHRAQPEPEHTTGPSPATGITDEMIEAGADALTYRTDADYADLRGDAKAVLAAALAGRTVVEPDSGTALIAAERRRQVEAKGYSAVHDDRHDHGQLLAAAFYFADEESSATDWPWDDLPPERGTDRVRDLERAGALIAAELDRLVRYRDRLHRRLAAESSGDGESRG